MTLPNRRARRAMGFRGPAYQTVSHDSRPRFVRRHLEGVLSSPSANRTRRVRKAVARMRREAIRLGIVKGQ